MDQRLDDTVRAALQTRRGTWPSIASSCGVSYSWLSKFARGTIANPGYEALRRLHDHLVQPAPARQ